MNRQKPNSLRRYGICLLILCLCGCIVLSVGLTYARYRTQFLAETYKFSAYTPESYLLHGEVMAEQLADVYEGRWPSYPDTWTPLNPEDLPETGENIPMADAEFRFSISNGKSGAQYARRDQEIILQLVAPLTIEAPENLTVSLIGPDLLVPENSFRYTAVAEPIQAGSFLYETYGDGWVYRFFAADGQTQAAFPLEGGQLNYTNFVIYVAGDISPSLLSLEITGQFTE